MLGKDLGYLALVIFLIVLPVLAIVAAVVDRALLRRRDADGAAKQAVGHGFEVIPVVKPGIAVDIDPVISRFH